MGSSGSLDKSAEERRLVALERMGLLDAPGDAGLDRITVLAARLFHAPAAVLAIVDRDRVQYKSRHGVTPDGVPRSGSFSGAAIGSGTVLVVSGAECARYSSQPELESGGAIGFYAGAPLIAADGPRLGALAVLDTRPRQDFGEEERASLADLAALAMREIAAHAAGEAKFRALMESASQGILAVDRGGRIETVNRKAEEIFGYSREEMLGQSLEMLLPEALRDAHAAHREGYFAAPRTRPMGIGMELAGRRKNCQQFPLEISLNHVQVDGRQLAIGFVTDISERIRLEQQLRQSQKMEAIGQLAGGVAHDFNNLLTVIQGYASMSLEGMAPDDVLREPLEEIERAAVSAGALTGQLLAFSRRRVVRPAVLDLNAVITHAEKMLRRMIGEDIELSLECAPDLGPVEADPGSIEQILMNLAVNSRDAMPGGGKLIIETANLFLDRQYTQTHLAVNTGLYAMLAVSDTGTGMSPEVQARIFEPFFTTKEPGAGTGLGLATVYGIVQQIQGTIWVYSEPGRGSTFKILLPVKASGAEMAVPAAEESAPGASGEVILLVEDEAGVRKFVRAMLERHGYRVLEAAGPEEALVLGAGPAERIDALLTDVVMPRMNGPELAARLTAARPGLKVMFMSGYTDRAIRLHDQLAADAAYVQKPFTPQTLTAKLSQLLGTCKGKGNPT
ncbi:MAG: PAS domain S-box protein [Acidobacteriota bacterium]|nr:PAS domain S-box protein [Acidobacteriota bacterium]